MVHKKYQKQNQSSNTLLSRKWSTELVFVVDVKRCLLIDMYFYSLTQVLIYGHT